MTLTFFASLSKNARELQVRLERVVVSRRSLIENGILIAAGFAAKPALFAKPSALFSAPLATPGDEVAGASPKTWAIGNDKIRRTLAFHPETGLLTEQWTDLSTHADFIRPGMINMGMAQEFSFLCNGHRCEGTNAEFEFVDAGEAAFPQGKSLTIKLRHKQLALEVSAIYIVYNGHPAIRKHLTLRNTGAATLRFSHLCIEAVGVSLGSENEVTLLTQYGTIPREIFYTGRSEDAGLLLANGRTGIGLAILSEVPGYMKRTEISGWDDPEHARIGSPLRYRSHAL